MCDGYTQTEADQETPPYAQEKRKKNSVIRVHAFWHPGHAHACTLERMHMHLNAHTLCTSSSARAWYDSVRDALPQ